MIARPMAATVNLVITAPFARCFVMHIFTSLSSSSPKSRGRPRFFTGRDVISVSVAEMASQYFLFIERTVLSLIENFIAASVLPLLTAYCPISALISGVYFSYGPRDEEVPGGRPVATKSSIACSKAKASANKNYQ